MYAVVLDDQYADFDVQSYGVQPDERADRQLRLEGIESLIGMTRGANVPGRLRRPRHVRASGTRVDRVLSRAFEPSRRSATARHTDRGARGATRVEVRATARIYCVARRQARELTTVCWPTRFGRPDGHRISASGGHLQLSDPENGLVRVLIGAGLGRVTTMPREGHRLRGDDDRGRLVTGRRYDVDPRGQRPSLERHGDAAPRHL